MKVLSVQKNSRNCLICGMENEFGLKAPFYNLEDGSVATIVEFKPNHQSYPERTHGGMVGALLDELMGRVLWATEPDTYGVTTTMTITYRKPTPYSVKLKARAIMEHNSKLGFSAKAQLFDMNGVLLVESQGRYLKLSDKKAFGENAHPDEEMCYVLDKDIEQIDF